jgi:hypothetical protein
MSGGSEQNVHCRESASELAVIDHEAEFEFGPDLLVSSVTARYGPSGAAHRL